MTIQFNDVLYKINETWATKKPAYLWSRAGRFATMVTKRNDWEGDVVAKVPVKDRLNGMVGPNYSEVYNNSTPLSGKQFKPIAREHHVTMRLSRRALGFGTARGNVDGVSTVMDAATDTGISFMRSLSYVFWGDGTGRIAKGDGLYSVAGDTITFRNAASVNQFEEGDRILLIDEGAAVPASGMPTPRAFAAAPNDYLEIIAINGTSIQVDKNVTTAIPTAVNTDYISKTSLFSGEFGLIDGVFRWIPRTDAEAATTWAEVDRSVNTKRLAGRRILVPGNPTPYQIIGAMGEEILNAKGGINEEDDYMIFVPSSEIPNLMQEMQSNGVIFQDAKTTADVKTMTLGVEYTKAAWPGVGTVGIVADHFLHDPTKTKDQDRSYVMLNMNDWYFKTEATGISWKNYEGSGNTYIKNIPGSKDFYGEYGVTGGNLFCNAPAMQIIAQTS